ncbi:MAG: desulfoferrodoxin Dfx [Eubacterium sp.]|nr:desulfoferrodoxin Dfx [Eubacterium sp.]
MKVFKCTKCDNMISYLNKAQCDVKCCGETMVELEPNTSDGAGEKHVPVVTIDGNIVTVAVGEVDHPMLDAHFIQWIAIETEQGRQRKTLKPGDKPVASFALVDGDKVKEVYEYCNLHGLWKTVVE